MSITQVCNGKKTKHKTNYSNHERNMGRYETKCIQE
jgi:hypothetical protein